MNAWGPQYPVLTPSFSITRAIYFLMLPYNLLKWVLGTATSLASTAAFNSFMVAHPFLFTFDVTQDQTFSIKIDARAVGGPLRKHQDSGALASIPLLHDMPGTCMCRVVIHMKVPCADALG